MRWMLISSCITKWWRSRFSRKLLVFVRRHPILISVIAARWNLDRLSHVAWRQYTGCGFVQLEMYPSCPSYVLRPVISPLLNSVIKMHPCCHTYCSGPSRDHIIRLTPFYTYIHSKFTILRVPLLQIGVAIVFVEPSGVATQLLSSGGTAIQLSQRYCAWCT